MIELNNAAGLIPTFRGIPTGAAIQKNIDRLESLVKFSSRRPNQGTSMRLPAIPEGVAKK